VFESFLKYRAEFGTAPSSTSSSAQEQADQWGTVMRIDATSSDLKVDIDDLKAYFRWVRN